MYIMYSCLAKLFKGTRYVQYVTVLIASLGVTSTSTYLSWPSPTLPKLTADNSSLGTPLNPEETSWIVAIFLLTGLPAALTYHVIIGRFGRKQTLRVVSVFLFVPWFLIIFGDDVIYIYIARGVGGCVLGTTLIVSVSLVPINFIITLKLLYVWTTAMYTAEIADADIRGRLGTSYGVMKLLGSILVLSIGPFVSYTVLAIVCAVIPLLFFFLLFAIPESPYFLVKNDRMDEARAALIYLSGTEGKKLIDKKINAIVFYVQSKEESLTLRQVMTNRIYVKVIAVLLTVTTLEYFAGVNAIAAYQQVVIDRSGSSISPEISSIIFGVIQIPAAVISAILVDKLGRKVILYVGGIGCSIPLAAEGIYFFMEDFMKVDVSGVSWLPTTGIVVYLIMYAVQVSIPYILLGEFFIDKIKNVGTMYFLLSGVLAVFLVTRTFEPIVEAWGMYTVFWIFTFFSLTLVIFTYFFVPETKGKTFEEIAKKLYN